MGEPTLKIDNKVLEDAVNNALKNYFPRLEPTSNVRVQFYNKFQGEADDHDKEFLVKYNGALDTTLIFAGLFSAVSSAFIVAVQTQLQPDYAQLTYDVLVVMANSTGTLPPKPSSDTPWNGPDPTLTYIQCILFSSLAASLLAAFVAMLGKQWLNRYSKVDMRGSLIDRSRDRQRKMDGMSAWGFNFVMESLPLMLQAALLLLGYALSNYLLTIDKVVAGVIIGFTGVGLLFYALIAISAILSYNCPFQTPLSLLIRYIWNLIKDHKKHFDKSRRWFRRTFCRMVKQLRSNQGRGSGTADRRNDIELANHAPPFDLPPTFFDEDANREGYVLDSNCIVWMFKMSMDADVILDIMRFIPEVVWHAGIQTTPLEKLYDTVVECFDCSSEKPVIIPKFRDKAYLSAKALLHVAVQRRCWSNESDDEAFETIAHRHRTIGYDGDPDPDLESTLGMLDRVFATESQDLKPIRWQELAFTDSHRAWMGQILLYRAWDSLRNGDLLPDDIKEFVLHSLQVKRPPPAPIVTSSLLMIGLVLKIKLRFDDQKATDKSQKFLPQIDKIYKKLGEIFKGEDLTIYEINRALQAMELLAPLSKEIAENSYTLFTTIAEARFPETHSEKKWEASRLAMDGAFKWDGRPPEVKDPQNVLHFLNHHFFQASGSRDEPIQNALRALGSVSISDMNNTLEHFDLTQPSFVNGICFMLKADRPAQIRKAALLFLPLIAEKWFNTRDRLMEDGKIKCLCEDWASAIDQVGTTNDVRKAALNVLLNMINSPHWRPHIVAEKWLLLERCISDPDNSRPLKRCLRNPGLIDAIPAVGDPSAKVLWLKILWFRYEELTADVQERLKAATSEVPWTDVQLCLNAVESELGKIESALLNYDTWSEEPGAVHLRKKKKSLEETKKFLLVQKQRLR